MNDFPPLPKRLDYRAGETPEFSAQQMRAYLIADREARAAAYAVNCSIGEDEKFLSLARSIGWTNSVDGQIQRLVSYLNSRDKIVRNAALGEAEKACISAFTVLKSNRGAA